MPPPATVAELPESVLFVTASVPPELQMPPPLRGGVAGEGAVGDASACRALSDAAAAAIDGGVAGEGAVGERQRAGVVDAAAGDGGGVAGEGAVGHGQRAGVVDGAAVLGRAVGEGQPAQGDGGAGVDLEDAAGPVGIDGQAVAAGPAIVRSPMIAGSWLPLG